MDLSQLETRGYVNVLYPPGLRAEVRNAMRLWEEFCKLPNEVKIRFSYSGDRNVSGVGYELKLEKGSTKDLKEDFHVRNTEIAFLRAEAEKIGPTAEKFIDAAFELNAHIAPVIQEFAAQAETQFNLVDFTRDTAMQQPRALIRFLHYFGDRAVGDEMAVPHVDKGGFTLHLYESHPGLEYLSYERRWVPMAFSEHETAIIPAMRLQLRSQNTLKATCHRVVANEETARNGRFSAVCFVDFNKTPYYDKVKNGRLQDRDAGFNYAIPLSELAGLFIPH